mgnify:CR=1 FL=1
MANHDPRLARLMKEKKLLQQDPIPGVNILWPNNSINEMVAEITAPEDSIYHDDIFTVKFSFDANYPRSPPRVVMLTPIFHPNIDSKGSVCLISLRKSFYGQVTIKQIISEIIIALKKPNPEDQLNVVASTMMKSDPQKFEYTVRQQVTKNCAERDS